jgi:maltose alpha-D-glucosyltransferase/alpha-amylase
VSTAFLNSYLATAGGASFLPKTKAELQVLLDSYLLEKVIYELGYELNNRPDWVEIPLRRILQLQEFASGGNHTQALRAGSGEQEGNGEPASPDILHHS